MITMNQDDDGNGLLDQICLEVEAKYWQSLQPFTFHSWNIQAAGGFEEEIVFLLICGEFTDTNIPVNLVFIKHFVMNSWISFGFKVSNSGSGVWQFPLQARV